MLLLPCFDGGFSPVDVGQWDLDDYSWWYLFRAKRVKAVRRADQEARAKASLRR